MGRSMSRRRKLLAVAAVLLLAYFYVSADRYVRAPTAEEAARARKLYLPGAEPVIGHPSAPLGASASSHPDACAGDACVTCTICTLVDEDGEWKSGDEYCSTKGDFTIVMKRAWAPLGYDRFLELVRANFFDNQIIYRVLPGLLVQFGVATDPSVQAKWSSSTIKDDPQQNIPFTAGTVSFAGSGQDSRSSHIFIALDPAGKALGTALHERPFGRIHAPRQQKMVASLYSGYGDLTDLQSELTTRGNAAADQYPLLDRIKRCYIESSDGGGHEPQPAAVLSAGVASVVFPPNLPLPESIWLHIEGIGAAEMRLNSDARVGKSVAALKHLASQQQATSGAHSCRIHRAEPLPQEGSGGPPYALVQFALDDAALAGLPHEGATPITRGSVCLIGGSSDVFVSLARHGEHRGWETSMTVVGHIQEPALSELIEGRVLALPKHNYTHPTFGTLMSMLDSALPCSLRLSREP